MSEPAASGSESTIRLFTRETTRSARYAAIGADPEVASRIWFALHGYGQLADRFLRPFDGNVPADTCVIAPEGLSRFYLEAPRADGSHMQRVGASWLTREQRELEIADAMLWLDQVHDEVTRASWRATGIAPWVGVLGFSQGVATAMRWIARGHVAPSQVVAWAGGLAHDADVTALRAKLAHAELTLVCGDDDQFATVEARERILAAARELHPSPREILFAGRHQLDGDVLRSILSRADILPANTPATKTPATNTPAANV